VLLCLGSKCSAPGVTDRKPTSASLRSPIAAAGITRCLCSGNRRSQGKDITPLYYNCRWWCVLCLTFRIQVIKDVFNVVPFSGLGIPNSEESILARCPSLHH